MGEGLLVQDRNGAIVDCNQAACNLLRAAPEKLRGQTLFKMGWTLLREDGTPLPREDYPSQQVMRGGSPVRNLVLGLRPERAGAAEPQAPAAPQDSRAV